MECRERTPSVIARLMGLDRLPPQQPVYKEQRVLSENYLRKTASIGVLEKRSSPEGSPFRMKIDEQQNCKDILEVPESIIQFNRKVMLEPTNNRTATISKIVVLRPNHGKSHRTMSRRSCEEYLSGDWNHKDSSGLESGIPNKTQNSRCRSKFYMEASKSNLRGSDTYACESEMVAHSSPNNYDGKNRSSNGSLLTLVAKQHISDRWKTTKRFQEAGLASSGCSLGEMLAMSDLEICPTKAYKLHNKHDLYNRLGQRNGEDDAYTASGISSTDGWKDGRAIRSNSLCASPYSTRSPKSRTSLEAPYHDKMDIDEKYCSRSRNSKSIFNKPGFDLNLDLGNGNVVITEETKFDNPKLTGGESWLGSESNGASRRIRVIRDESKDNFEKNLSEKSLMLWSSFVGDGSKSMISNSVTNAKMKRGFKRNQTEQQSKTKSYMLVKDTMPSFRVRNSSNQQAHSSANASSAYGSIDTNDKHSQVPARVLPPFPGKSLAQKETSARPYEENAVPVHGTKLDPESPASSESASQPSPVSVLESQSQQESGIEGFERASVDLQGLWTQLQLLKANSSSEECSEGSGMNVSSDENEYEASTDAVKNKELIEFCNTKESMNFSYLVDILSYADFNCNNFETSLKQWHSLQCPINPVVFETLEKRYGQQTQWEKPERKLLFDRINLALMDILQSYIDMNIESKSVLKRVCCNRNLDLIEEEVWTLLVRQEKEATNDKMDRVFEYFDDLDATGREIETLLLEELILECVEVNSF